MRRRRVRVQPSKPAMILSLFVGIIFVLVGIFIAIPTFGLFGIFWTFIAVFITLSNAAPLFGKEGHTRQIIIEDDEDTDSSDPFDPLRQVQYPTSTPYVSDAEQRLQELQNLYNKGLITRDEYDAKRAEIIEKL